MDDNNGADVKEDYSWVPTPFPHLHALDPTILHLQQTAISQRASVGSQMKKNSTLVKLKPFTVFGQQIPVVVR